MSHPDKIHNQNNQQEIAKIPNEKSQSSCIHTLLLLPCPKNITLLRTSFLRFLNKSQSEKLVQRRLHAKTSKTKEATKEIRNNIADGHKMYTDLKCTAHGLAMMSFV